MERGEEVPEHRGKEKEASPSSEEDGEEQEGSAEDHMPLACPLFGAEDEEEEGQEGSLLVVLVHGFLGTTADFAACKALMEKRHPDAVVMVSSRNAAMSSNAGIAAGGRVLAREVADQLLRFHFPGADLRTVANEYSEQPLLQLESIRDSVLSRARQVPPLRLLAVGHSLGGLYLRYAVGLLHEAGFLTGPDRLLVPVSYVSVASPHLGSRRPKVGVKSRFIQATLESASIIGSRTISDLLMRDGHHPLLVAMSEPQSCFMKGLALFRNRTAVSTTHYDQIVPFASAAIMVENPYTPVRHSTRFFVIDCSGFSDAYEPLVSSYRAQEHHHQEDDPNRASASLSDSSLPLMRTRQKGVNANSSSPTVLVSRQRNVTSRRALVRLEDGGVDDRDEEARREEKERDDDEREEYERDRTERNKDERKEADRDIGVGTDEREREDETKDAVDTLQEEEEEEKGDEDEDKDEYHGSGFVVDADGQLEYLPEVLNNLCSLHWRRLHVQFSSASRLQRWMAHEAPLAKKKSQVVSQVFHLDTSSGKDFLALLLDLLDLDCSGGSPAASKCL